jgi:8-oxo-dGTP diphosphatase
MPEINFEIPRLGVAIILLQGGFVLMGKRRSLHGEGTWAFPGGHVELGEDPRDTAIRELKEEIGDDCEIRGLTPYRPTPWVSTVFPDGKHYVTLFFWGEVIGGEPKLMEPNKCAGWKWCDTRYLPSPLFEPIKSLEFI